MKSYSHLYPAANARNILKKNANSPKKASNPTNTLQNKSSMRTLATYNTVLNRTKKINDRLLTRSIQEMHICKSSTQNDEPQFPIDLINNQQDELFGKSYSKISQLKSAFHTKSIDIELNEVLSLIKQQKTKIHEKMNTLKKSNDYYKQLCKGYSKNMIDSSINTEIMISLGMNADMIDEQTQTEEEVDTTGQKIKEEQSKQCQMKDKIDGRQVEVYTKLSSMLQDMNINPKDILPEEVLIDFKVKEFKQLSETQIIKIQKFFIKKLMEKIQK